MTKIKFYELLNSNDKKFYSLNFLMAEGAKLKSESKSIKRNKKEKGTWKYYKQISSLLSNFNEQ